jgi:AAA domain-containing protein
MVMKTELRAAINAFGNDCFAPHQEEKRIQRVGLACLYQAQRDGKVPLLLGGVGLGKTHAARAIAERFVSLTGTGPVVYVQIAPPGGGAFNFSVACGQIMRELGRPQQLIDLAERAPWDHSPRHVLIEATQRELIQRRPGVLILDEIERMFGNRTTELGHLETLAWWGDTAKVPIFAVGNYQAARAQTVSTKNSRRFLRLHYEPYEKATGFKLYLSPFKTMIKFLEDHALLASQVATTDLAQDLFRATNGRVGETKSVLMLAGEIAVGEQRPITKEDIEAAIEIKLSKPVRDLFNLDLLAGRTQLTRMLKNPAQQQTNPAGGRAKGTRLPGRRNPSIDVIGEGAA